MIDVSKYINKKNILIVCLILVMLCIGFLVYDKLHFRLKFTTPPIDKIPNSSVRIKYHFSQPIKSVNQVLVDGNIVHNTTIDGSVITIPLDTGVEEDVEYSIELKSVNSVWFNNNIQSIKQSFTPYYVEYGSLSKEEKKSQIDASHSGQVDDPFMNKNEFPIFNDRWQIDAETVTDTRSVILKVIFFTEVPDYDNGGSIKQVSNEVAEDYRKQVLEEIKKRGGSAENYTIIYSNRYLYEKYNNHATH